MPPLNLKSCASTGSTRSSRKRISSPLLRNAISRRRSIRVWARNSVSSKMVSSGQNVIVVPCFFDGADLGELVLGLAALGEVLHPLAAVAVDLDVEPARERIDHRRAHAVQAARDLVALTAELPARVQHGHDDLGRGLALVLRVVVDRHAASVVGHATAAVGEQGHVDARAVTRHRLVDGVVDDLVDQVVEARRAGGSDVHPGPLTDRFETLENGDVLGGIRHARVPRSLPGRGPGGWLGEGVPERIRNSVKPQVRARKDDSHSVPDGPPDPVAFRSISRAFRRAPAQPTRTRTDVTAPGPTRPVARSITVVSR